MGAVLIILMLGGQVRFENQIHSLSELDILNIIDISIYSLQSTYLSITIHHQETVGS